MYLNLPFRYANPMLSNFKYHVWGHLSLFDNLNILKNGKQPQKSNNAFKIKDLIKHFTFRKVSY